MSIFSAIHTAFVCGISQAVSISDAARMRLTAADGFDELNAGVEKAADTVVEAAAKAELPAWIQRLIDTAVTCGLKLFHAVVVAAVGWYIIKLLSRWTKKLLSRSNLDDSIAGFLVSVVNTVLKAILVITIIGVLGIPMSSIVAVIGSAGLAIGLALQGCLTNFAGGVLILVLKPFKVGDYIIEDGGHEGTVTAIDIIYTKLLTPDNRAVTIPNGTLANSTVINATKENYRRLDFPVPIGYNEDIDKVKKLLLEIAMENDSVLKDRDCIAFVDRFDASSISVVLRFWVQADQYWPVKWEIQETIKKTLDKNNIVIPFDQLDIHMVAPESPKGQDTSQDDME